MTTSATNPIATAKTPSHVAYHVREDIGGKAIWTKIGIVWPHRDLKGGTIYVTGLPEDGRIILRSVNEAVE